MPLLKRSVSSASVNTTASVFTARKGNYQKALGILNVYIMVTSLFMVILGILFMKVYHMDKIYTTAGKVDHNGKHENGLEDFWTFGWLPCLLVGIGTGTFVVSMAGFLFAGMESKPPLVVYGVIMALLVLFQCFFIYVTFNADAFISQSNRGNAIQEVLKRGTIEKLIRNDTTFKENWYTIQSKLRCCGIKEKEDLGRKRQIFKNLVSGCYPESCCINKNGEFCKKPCGGDGKLELMKHEVREIYTIGCTTVLEGLYKEDLPKIFLFIELNGAVTILVEIAAIALASAYVAQIARRAKRWNVGQDGIELD